MDAATIEPMTAAHWPETRAIFEQGIATGDATFETAAPSWAAWDAGHLAGHRLVAIVDGQVAGWAALSPVSDRCAYAGVAEASVYVAAPATGRGVGRALLDGLVGGADAAGIWTSRPASSPRTRPAWPCTGAAASAPSGCASASASWTAAGGTWSCWSGAARWSPEPPAQPEVVRGREARARSARRKTSSTSPEALTRRTRPT